MELATTNYQPAAKKARMGAIVVSDSTSKKALINAPDRISDLQAPTMLLSGHQDIVHSVKFSNDGASLASASRDMSVLLWKTFGDCENYANLKIHKNAVLDLAWSYDDSMLVSASADKTAIITDARTFERMRGLREHTSYVNAVSTSRRGRHLCATVSDDKSCKIWDMSTKYSEITINTAGPLCAVAMSDDSQEVHVAGVSNVVLTFDLRRPEKIMRKLPGHTDTITHLAVSPDGSRLLSNSMDQSIKIWNINSHADSNRLTHTLMGHKHDFEKNLLRSAWSWDGNQIASGSADRNVLVWNARNSRLMFKLPGHKGSVNGVDFHPNQPIVASGSSDGRIYLGEINPVPI